jgi:hypothetical protein
MSLAIIEVLALSCLVSTQSVAKWQKQDAYMNNKTERFTDGEHAGLRLTTRIVRWVGKNDCIIEFSLSTTKAPNDWCLQDTELINFCFWDSHQSRIKADVASFIKPGKDFCDAVNKTVVQRARISIPSNACSMGSQLGSSNLRTRRLELVREPTGNR